MILYISGPMTGIPEYNYPAFHAAKQQLLDDGYDVISPADLPLKNDWGWSEYMDVNVSSVFKAEGVALLPQWRKSKGARIEVAIALQRNLPCKNLEEWLSP